MKERTQLKTKNSAGKGEGWGGGTGDFRRERKIRNDHLEGEWMNRGIQCECWAALGSP